MYTSRNSGLKVQGWTVTTPHFFTLDSPRWNIPLLCSFWKNMDTLEPWEMLCLLICLFWSLWLKWFLTLDATEESHLALQVSLQIFPHLSSTGRKCLHGSHGQRLNLWGVFPHWAGSHGWYISVSSLMPHGTIRCSLHLLLRHYHYVTSAHAPSKTFSKVLINTECQWASDEDSRFCLRLGLSTLSLSMSMNKRATMLW